MSRRWKLVVNPHSGGGATGGRLAEIRAAASVLGTFEIVTTEGPGHATALARQAVDDGFDRIVAIGGDGTANEVVNGLFDGRTVRRPDVAFGLVHGGTGGDLVKTLRMPAALPAAFERLATATVRPIDVLHVAFVDHAGLRAERIGVNVVGFGMNGAVVDRANRSSKRWGGRVTFLAATIATVRTYEPVPVRITWVDHAAEPGEWSGRLSAAFVANGQYCGGGMWVGRGSSIDDGAADATLIPQLPLSRMILGGPRLFFGTIERVKEVSRIPVRSLSASADSASEVRLDVDGEQPGFLPVEITVLEKAMLVAY